MVSKTMIGIYLFAMSIGLQALSFFVNNGTISKLSVVGTQTTTQVDNNSVAVALFFISVAIAIGAGVYLIKERKHLKLKY